MILAEQESERYTNLYTSDIARRKYNAELQIMKDSEIYETISQMFQYKADSSASSVSDSSGSESISIGSTSIGNSNDAPRSSVEVLNKQAEDYHKRALKALSSIMPNGIPVSYNETAVGYSKHLSPTTGLRTRI